MARVPDGSRCVNTERSIVDRPTVVSSPAVSRRTLLGGLAAACGFAATTPQMPLKSVPIELIDTLAQPVVERISVAIGCHRNTRPWLIAPSERHIAESFLWQNLKDDDTRKLSIVAGELGFSSASRCYLPVACSLDLDYDDTFKPAHCLDWPRVLPDYADFGRGRVREGIEIAEYGDVEKITTRHDAMQIVASMNREILDTEANEDGELSETAWWVVLEIGSELTPSWIDPALCAGVGKAQINLELACRIAVPTAVELARFGKGGAA